METLLQFGFYALGFIGLVGFCLIPLRTFMFMRRFTRYWRASVFTRLLLVFFALVATSLMVAEVHLVSRIFGCLIGDHCGPNRASGWIYVAGVGFWYIVLEAIGFTVSYAFRKMTGARPNNSSKPTANAAA